ncbi:hypothetical protein EZV62_008588 [Acer yangbiense]|uniref:Uncharacterized protein n=1 Tax=Acer yangbiense TaxID=1000413 RepID=A0A5C7IDA9_9ROSI|nr:hypothetical protein EZV62_008588 [Acer yangbiense]
MLPSNDTLARRKLSVNKLCPICNCGVETTLHSLWSCRNLKLVRTDWYDKLQDNHKIHSSPFDKEVKVLEWARGYVVEIDDAFSVRACLPGENFINSIVHFNGKNYASWEFQFRMYVKGKELWGHVDGSSTAPTDPKELSLWEGKDAKIASWLLSSVEPYMVNNLRGFTTVKQMWDYLRQIYYQHNSTRKFQLELDIGNYR